MTVWRTEHRKGTPIVDYAAKSIAASHSKLQDCNWECVQVWDKRAPQSVAGILVGHTQGLTYLDPKGDGRYLLSNSKDQSAKIWDIRKMMSRRKFRARKPSSNPPQFGW